MIPTDVNLAYWFGPLIAGLLFYLGMLAERLRVREARRARAELVIWAIRTAPGYHGGGFSAGLDVREEAKH